MSRWRRVVEPHDGDISERRSIFRRLTLRDNAGRSFLERRGIDVRLFGVYVHRITAPDPGLDLHDHPWPFVSLVLKGGYCEHHCDTRFATDNRQHRLRGWGRWSIHRMPLTTAHRIAVVRPGTTTLVLRGRKVRPWGFYTPDGYVDQRAYDYVTRRPVTAARG